jgi:hypothetical protein
VNLRRPAALLALTALTGALVFATASAASAAPVTITVGDYKYSADDGNVAAGAKITNYTGGPIATIPDTVTIGADTYDVTAIGYTAFISKSLTSVTIPDTVTFIDDFSFYNNPLLTSVDFGNSVTTIGEYAFNDAALLALTIPDSVITIGYGAFASNEFTSVTLGNSLTTIGASAFAGNALTSVTFPDSVTTIGDSAFSNNDLTSVTLGNSITSVGSSAFLGNPLTSLDLGNSVTTLGDYSFYGNSLTSLVIPATVTTIGSNAFWHGSPLPSVTFLGATPTTFGVYGGGSSLGDGTGLTIYYNWAFDSAQVAGGFTTPTWSGYSTVEQANVTFTMGEYGTAPATQTITVGDTATKPADPTSTKALFTGWYTNAGLTTKADFADPVTSNLTLFAGWTTLAATGTNVTPLTIAVPSLLVVLGLGLVLVSRRTTVATN